MSTSEKQISANRVNADRSMGPRTAAGKRVASRNAQRHGVLSGRLFLDDEDPDEFALLVAELQGSLNPVGALEAVLVERIAVTIWRQHRLVAAETATLDLSRQGRSVAKSVSGELGRGFGHEVSERDLGPVDKDQFNWCSEVIDEIENLEELDLVAIEKLPLTFHQLKSEADDDGQSPGEYLDEYTGGLAGFLAELLSWCRKRLQEAEERPRIMGLAESVRQKRLVLPEPALVLLSRYQTTLDNQLYKALKALREAQEWRLKCLEAVADDDEPKTDSAA
ncbi:MAG: hypothetical protein NXI02_28650 [Rhodobacteraceae bacterium]|nr:hypothetical protein [Paracoccaceae bacterium]